VLDRVRGTRDVKLAVRLVDDEWRVADDGVAHIARLNMARAVIEIHPAKLVFIDAYDHKLLDVTLVVAR
jgi:hypothetical protein